MESKFYIIIYHLEPLLQRVKKFLSDSSRTQADVHPVTAAGGRGKVLQADDKLRSYPAWWNAVDSQRCEV